MLFPVLVVEDDRKIANVVKVYLEGAGYRVVIAGKGKDAIVRAQKDQPALVILDLMLPDISGEEVCQELKLVGDFPIIMLTSKSSEEERIAGFALGADDYVVKPFSPRELVARVKAVIKRARKKELSEEKPMNFNNQELSIDGRSYEITKKGAPVKLTPTEFKILFVIAGSPGRVWTRAELVDHALGYQFEGYENGRKRSLLKTRYGHSCSALR